MKNKQKSIKNESEKLFSDASFKDLKTQNNFYSERNIGTKNKYSGFEKYRKDLFGNLIICGKKKHCVVLNVKPTIINVECWKSENKKMNFPILKKHKVAQIKQILNINQPVKKQYEPSSFFQNSISSVFMMPMF